ncbi:MAG: PKD domain-containing protein, partial [Anaerolineae bacterium]
MKQSTQNKTSHVASNCKILVSHIAPVFTSLGFASILLFSLYLNFFGPLGTAAAESFKLPAVATEFSIISDGPYERGERSVMITATNNLTETFSYIWNWGDGSPEISGTESTVSHVYAESAVYTITAGLVDVANNRLTRTLVIDLPPIRPIVGLDLNGKSLIPSNEAVSFEATIDQGDSVTYTWDMGDGTPPVTTTTGLLADFTFPDFGIYDIVVTAENPVSVMTSTFTAAYGVLNVTTSNFIDPNASSSFLPEADSVISGSSAITLADSSGFSTGNEVLLLTMDGVQVGTFETATVSSTVGNTLILVAPVQNSYAGTDKIVVQKVPHYDTVTIADGASLTAPTWDGQTGGMVAFEARVVTIEAGGEINLTGKGYQRDTGPGLATARLGSSHGGAGYASDKRYGIPYTPTALGSGGSFACIGGFCTFGGHGGGAIFVTVDELFVNDGQITASGTGGQRGWSPSIPSGGGGTGGSVYIVTPLLEGSGEISADGGSANSIRNGWPGATGAGGRVAVLAELSNYQGTISANTGSTINDAYLSFDGTVYLGLVDPVFSTAEVGSATTLIDGSVATVTVTLKDQYGMPAVNQPVSITVSGMDNSVFNSVGATVLPNDRFYALGRTDSNGVITGTVLSTKAESKTIVAWSGFVQVLDYAQTTFVANVPSAAQSILEVLGPNKIGADGVASGRLQATIRDEFDNVISDVVSVTLSATDPAVAIMTETVATNSDGQIVFNASSLNPNIVDFQASVLGELIPIVEPLSFVGAELDVVVSGRGQMARGLPIVHTISVRNIGFLPAEDTVVTVTLPTELVGSVLSLESGVTNPTAGVYVWDLSQLAPQPAADMLVISSTLSIDSAVDTSVAVQATASTSSVDVFPENNTSQRTLLILQEAPQLSSTLSNNSIQVLPNGSSTLTVTLTNNGTAALENARVNLDGAFPWLTLPVKNFGTIPAFGGSVTFAIEANPGTGVSTGFYNSDLSIVGDNLLPNTVLIRAYVQPPFRDLVVELDSDLGDPLSEAFVTMVSTRTIYTIGDPIIETVTVRDFTDANGRVTFANLETGKGYVVSATATDYQNLAANSLFLSEESESLLQAYTLSGIANLSISPNELNIFTAAEDDQAQTVVLENKGVSHLTNIQIQAPQTDVDFAYIGRVTTGTVNLAPGEAYTITFNTSVPEGKPDDVYSDNLTISADQLDPQQIPVNVEVDNGTLVDYCIDVYLKPLQTTLKGVRATLTERSSTELPFQREAYTDAINGMACFQQIPLDSYQVAVDWQGSQVVNEAVDVTFFSDSYKRFEIDFPPVEATWVVEPTTIVDVYTSTLTLDYRPKSPPILSASPREVRICQQDAGTIMETVTIHNFFPVEFTNVRIGLGYLGEVGDISATLTDPISGDSVAEGDILEIGSIAPNQDYELQLEAVLNQATCSNASGTVFLRVFADYQSYLPNGWYDVDQPIASVPLGLPASVPLKIAHRGYPEESNLNLDPPNLQNVTLTPPQVLTWMDISETKFDLIEVGTDVTFTLDIDAPEWLPNGIYQDYIVITSTNGITTVIGIEAERTDLGLEVETRFVTPLTVRDSNIPGNSLSPQEQYFAGVAEVFGSATVVEGTTSFINDTFTLKIGCKDCDQPKPVWRRVSPTRLKAVYVGRPPRIVSVPKPGPEPEPINRTILELSQGFALEREAFDARLSLANSFPVPIEDVTVNISISDREDELGETVSIRTYTQTVSTSSPFVPNLPDQLPEPDIASNIPDTWRQSSLASFVMTPKPPTRIGDVAGNEETEFSWTLIPDATGIEDENGVPFYVQASIAYSVNVGSTIENYTLDTVPAEIFVRPQPLIMLDYYLPTYVLAGQEFEWIAYISNVGYGAARDLQITTPQPKIISTEGLPVDFVITNVGIGAPSTDSDPAGLMSAAKGSVTDSGASFVTIPPGRTIEMKIKVVASEDGAMAGASVDCTHRNYRGVELPPLIYCNPDVHFYDTNYLYYGEQQTLAKEECFTSQHQTFEGDPVNTFSGNFTLTEKDLMIPAWGDHPLKFERSYNALTQDDPGPFGPGWTHNYHMSVEYRPFISRDTNGNLLQSNLLSARLPHGSRVYFAVDENAEIVPLPGVRAQITETLGSYVVTQDCDQSVYKFDTIIFGDATARPDAVLTEMIDAHGNSTTFEYEPTHGYLTKVIEPGGREVTFEYVQNGDDWLVQSMTDPLGRTATYSYTDGYMTSATDFRGFTTVYSYTAPVDGQVGLLDTIFDPDGNIIVDNNYDESGRVTWQEDALGKRTSFIYAPGTISGTTQTTIIDPRLNPVIETYNEIGALVSREDALGQISTYEYDEDYNLVEVVDRNGQQTAYDWTDCNCNVSQIIDSLGFTMDVTYNEQKEITSIKDKRNATTTIEYDASGLNAERIIDPLGNETVYTHGLHGEILTAEDANSNVTDYSYDAYGNNIAITDALGQQTRIAYDAAGRVISTTNGLGETTEFVYDAENNLLELRAPLNATTTYAYDSRGNMTSMTDALGRTTTYGYNGRNEQVLVTDALGNTISMTYDGIGNLKTETDQNGNTRTFDYDALNRVETVIDPLDGTMTFTYDSEGNVLSETDPNGNTTTYQYVGNRVITTYADGSQMTADYDPEGNLVSIVDDLNRSVAYVYDLAGRLTTQTNALLDDIGYAYDPAGNMIAMTDELGRVTDYEYDALNRVVTTTNPISGTTVIDYDAIGQRTGLTDPNGNSWEYVYDPLHRLTEAIDPLNGRTRYSFDLVGNVRQIIDPLGRETTVEVDDLNRTIEVVNPISGTIQYGYDNKGIVTSVIDSEGRLTSFEHDDLDRLITMINPVGDTIGYTYDANGNMLSRTDEEGRTTTYDYDSLNQQVRMTDPLGGTVIYNYDAVGKLERFTDPNNHTPVYTYDQLDRVVQVRDPRNSTMSYVYNKVGNLTSETDFENNTQTYTYDAFNRLTAATNPLDQTTRFGYDLVGNMTSVTDADDETSTYGYDALNRATAITNPLDETVNYKYDAVGNQTVLTDTLGRATTFGYDGLNRLTTVIDPLGQTSVMTYSLSGNLVGTVNPAGQVTVYNYDPLDRVENIIDPLNQVTAFRYDKVGNQTRQTDPLLRNINFVYDQLNRLTQVQAPLGRTVTYTYDPVGNQLSMTDANTHRTNFVYDELNRLTQAIDPLSAVTSYTYDRNGNPLTITDPLGRAISYGYDGLNRPETLTDPEGNTTEFRYDDVGNQTEIIDARGFSTSFDYDALGRPIAITDAISGTLLLDYDEAGNQVGLTDALGRSTTNIYDDLDRLVQTINPLGEVTEYAYDPIGNLTSVTDALDRVTGYQYDRLNRPTLITDPLNNTIEYQYDPIGNVLAQIDPLGNMTAFQYDALNQPTRVTDALNGVIQYEYDPVGNVTAITDANGHRSTLGYDPLNRLERTTSALNEVTQYVYDLAGQNTSTIDPLGYTTQFSYDDVGRLETVIDPLNRATSYSYDPVGNPLEMTDGNGIVTRYAYDPLSRLASVTENYLPSPTADHQTNVQSQFSYDAVGNLTAMTNPLGNTFTFGYDALNRLEAATDPLGNAFNYGYDSVGNLDEMTDANGQLMTYQYDALDRLTQIQRPDELVTFAYDAVGNRLSMTDPTGVTQYVYDDLYRLTSVTDPQSQVVGYGYDPVGNRTSLTYPTGETVSYSYDAVDRLIQVDDWSAGQTAYNYDANSRLTNMSLPNDIVGTFGYDDANQLTQMAYANITETLQTYTYTYDSVGNRTQAIEQTITIAPEEVPQADFTAAPVIGGAPLTVTFSNQSLNGTSYLWDFGDGETDTTTNLTVTHIYSQPGTYTVTLEATNGGLTHVLTRTGLITVLSPETVVAQNGELVFETENPAA